MLTTLLGLYFMSRSSQPFAPVHQEPASVTWLKKVSGGFELLFNGKPYRIKGAGGDASRATLARLGGNSIRTWGAENLGQVLDEALRNHLTVTAGIWLGHMDQFDYHDAQAVAKQLDECRDVVRRYRNHPALLMWAFGNEMEGEGNDAAVWKAVEGIAAMSHREDPNHPTMTVICESIDKKIPILDKLCPSIDIVGLNSYGGGPSLAERYRKVGGTKPYIHTEFGPVGQWEVPVTSWHAPYEPTSTEKEAMYESSYRANVLENPSMCLGSYVFLWGDKIEATPTWFGMFLPDGAPTGSVDVMTQLWKGEKLKEHAPTIGAVKLSSTNPAPGETISAEVKAVDWKGRACTLRWELLREIEKWTDDVPRQVAAGTVPGATLVVSGDSVSVKLPTQPGAYRLYAFAYDSKGRAATANAPLYLGPIPKN